MGRTRTRRPPHHTVDDVGGDKQKCDAHHPLQPPRAVRSVQLRRWRTRARGQRTSRSVGVRGARRRHLQTRVRRRGPRRAHERIGVRHRHRHVGVRQRRVRIRQRRVRRGRHRVHIVGHVRVREDGGRCEGHGGHDCRRRRGRVRRSAALIVASRHGERGGLRKTRHFYIRPSFALLHQYRQSANSPQETYRPSNCRDLLSVLDACAGPGHEGRGGHARRREGQREAQREPVLAELSCTPPRPARAAGTPTRGERTSSL